MFNFMIYCRLRICNELCHFRLNIFVSEEQMLIEVKGRHLYIMLLALDGQLLQR